MPRYIILLSQPTVRAQFISEWDSPKDEVPSLAKVYEIINPRDIRNQHERYKRVPRTNLTAETNWLVNLDRHTQLLKKFAVSIVRNAFVI